MSPNEAAMRGFARQFSCILPVMKTARINNVPVHDGWTISYHDPARGIGLTAVAYMDARLGAVFHAYIEAAHVSAVDMAESSGNVMAQAMGLLRGSDGDSDD